NTFVYKYLSISHGIAQEKFQTVNLTFDIEKSWIDSNEIDNKQIYVERYESSNWKKYTSIILSENSTHISYQTDVPGLSYFIIGGMKKIKECDSGKKCSGKQLQECIDNKWVTEKTCINTCVNNQCIEIIENISDIESELTLPLEEPESIDKTPEPPLSLILFVLIIIIIFAVYYILHKSGKKSKKHYDFQKRHKKKK
ncbi:MAG: PGF-pre-PGF domain-containing protein, partial [Candidatus Aenigmatarchaeota archaeon]